MMAELKELRERWEYVPEGTRKTASGHYSTAAGVLDALRPQNPVVEMILEHRELAKLKSTYLDALPNQVNPRTSRVHTSYQQTGSVTGRLASSDPNLQNIPIRTELGRKVRRAPSSLASSSGRPSRPAFRASPPED